MLRLSLVLCLVASTVGLGSTERWILKNPSASASELHRGGVLVLNTIRFGRTQYLVVETPNRIDALSRISGSEDAMPDFPVGLHSEVSSPREEDGSAWHVTQLQYTNLPAKFDGRGIVVAVLDTGMDLSHPALESHLWVNPGEIAGNDIDDDGNGYIDDVHGYSFVRKSADVQDSGDHGTHTAGIIAADPQDSGSDSARGVAPGVKLMIVHIIEPDDAKTFLSDTALAIKYAVDNGARILSNSWRIYKSWSGFEPTEENVKLLKEAIEYAQSKNAIFVAAAGNEKKNNDTVTDPIFPVGFNGLSNLVGVAASDEKKAKAIFSNYGPKGVALAAPGDKIISTVPGGTWEDKSGTSMACPLVAGALARGLSAGLSPQKAIEALQDTSDVSAAWKTYTASSGVVNLVSFLKTPPSD